MQRKLALTTTAPVAVWNGLTLPVRIAIGAALVVAIAASVFFYGGRETQTTVFSQPLLADQLGEVERQLAGWNVPYRATTDNVLVPTKSRNDVLLRLSLAGIPHAHIAGSSETLAKIGALTPQSVLDAQTRDGLAGDLALGLRGITGVEDAHVIIAPASDGYFADQSSHAASASVRLALAAGVTLSPETVNGIKTFVANGVPGLDHTHVAVLDDRGVALTDRPAAGDSASQTLQQSIQSALDAAIGPGRSIVRAHVDVNARSDIRLETKRAPVLGHAIGSTSLAEHYQNGAKNYAKTQSSSDAGSDIVQNETRTDGGETQRVSIAVFLDQMLADETPRIRDLVASAGGIDTKRGDTVTVQPIALALTPPLQIKPANTGAIAAVHPFPAAQSSQLHALLGQYLAALPPVIIGIFCLGVAVLVARPLANVARSIVPASATATANASSNPVPPPTMPAGASPEAIFTALRGEPAYAAAAVIASLPTPVAAAVLDRFPDDVRREIVTKLAQPRSPLAMDLASAFDRG